MTTRPGSTTAQFCYTAVREGLIDVAAFGPCRHPNRFSSRTISASIFTMPPRFMPADPKPFAGPSSRRGVWRGVRSYLSFDIDGLDSGLCARHRHARSGGACRAAQGPAALLRGLAGIDLVGGDVVEVSPPFDHAAITAVARGPCGDGADLPVGLDTGVKGAGPTQGSGAYTAHTGTKKQTGTTRAMPRRDRSPETRAVARENSPMPPRPAFARRARD